MRLVYIMPLCKGRRPVGGGCSGQSPIRAFLSDSPKARRMPGRRSEEVPAWHAPCRAVCPVPEFSGNTKMAGVPRRSGECRNYDVNYPRRKSPSGAWGSWIRKEETSIDSERPGGGAVPGCPLSEETPLCRKNVISLPSSSRLRNPNCVISYESSSYSGMEDTHLCFFICASPIDR